MATTENCRRLTGGEETEEDRAVARWYSEQLREDPYRFLRGEEREQ